ncbi:MAG TPA: ATPase, partial [Terrisporobacter glycolicus]|uniref:HAD-IC family P-type ATPase n=1 Tax=Terrisporobacter hibernicus TaxID=2813371 RepID=UPI000E8DBF46
MFYKETSEKTIRHFKSSLDGLSQMEVMKRLKQNGPNELREKEKAPTWKLFLDSFKDPLVVILLIAALVQIFLGEVVESVIIFAVLILNSILGVVQTKKAEGSLDSLKQLSVPNAKVIRDGIKITVPSKDLVEGDIVVLEAGDYVPADGRIIEAQTFKVVEGMLTGESEPVLKHNENIEEEVGIGDQRNMVFSGSLVVYGRGSFVVTKTGMNTEMGKVAGLLESAESKQTPLQQKLDEFGK